MLKVLEVGSIDQLISEAIPENIRQKEPLRFGKPMSEQNFKTYTNYFFKILQF